MNSRNWYGLLGETRGCPMAEQREDANHEESFSSKLIVGS